MMGQLDDIAWGNGKRRRRYDVETIRAMRAARATGLTLKEVAKQFHTTPTTIREICNRQRYGEIE